MCVCVCVFPVCVCVCVWCVCVCVCFPVLSVRQQDSPLCECVCVQVNYSYTGHRPKAVRRNTAAPSAADPQQHLLITETLYFVPTHRISWHLCCLLITSGIYFESQLSELQIVISRVFIVSVYCTHLVYYWWRIALELAGKHCSLSLTG